MWIWHSMTKYNDTESNKVVKIMCRMCYSKVIKMYCHRIRNDGCRLILRIKL